MKRIEDIKEFEDIDTYYEISKIVEEVFQDRVEAHKHLVTANKEIERLNKKLEKLEKLNNANYQSFIEVNNIINELEKWSEEYIFADIFKNKLQELKGNTNEKDKQLVQ